jgi:hypothetical protein
MGTYQILRLVVINGLFFLFIIYVLGKRGWKWRLPFCIASAYVIVYDIWDVNVSNALGCITGYFCSWNNCFFTMGKKNSRLMWEGLCRYNLL